MKQIYKSKVEIFPLDDECFQLISERCIETGTHPLVFISDHINLSGKAIKDLGFIPITDLYVDEKAEKLSPHKSIVVAGLKEGVIPTIAEAEILKSQGILAYSYSLLEKSLWAAASGMKLCIQGFIPKIPRGFFVSGFAAGLKSRPGDLDLGIIFSEDDLIWAGVFTKNRARAICVSKNQELLGLKIKAIVVNSGNANACTGEEGERNDQKIKNVLARKLKTRPEEILTASTGKIGVQIPVEKIERSIENFSFDTDSTYNIQNFSKAILTTDTKTKIYQVSQGNGSILGFIKGSGMISPNMATMLGFLLTDFRIQGLDESQMQKAFQVCLSEVNENTFSAISIDSDTSTNDMVILASSQKGPEISLEKFKELLLEICKELAKKVVLDGEGASKFVELKIYNSKSDREAKLIGKSIIDSPLVKTALFGNDPNWGRIIMALGKTTLDSIDINDVELSILGEKVFSSGLPCDFQKEELALKMKKHRKIIIELNLDNTRDKNPDKAKTFWGNDLSYEYVTINAEYFT
jgi:glutamate N-acetyltransferase / amino-acid N-acetyltransferase